MNYGIGFPEISFGRSFGMEFTFEKYSSGPVENEKDYHMSCAFLNSLGIHSYVDCENVLEVPTPILYHSHDAILYSRIVKTVLSIGDYVNKNEWSTGGGCHVHLERKTDEFAANIFRVVYNRPWLNYVFQDWYDYDTSLPFQYFHSRKLYDSEQMTDTTFEFILDGIGYPDFSRESILRYKEQTDTLELRFFDMPSETSGIYEILKTTKVLCDLAKNKEEVKKSTKKTCLKRLEDGTYLKEWLKFKKEHKLEFGEANIKMRMLNMGVSEKDYQKMLKSAMQGNYPLYSATTTTII